MKMSIITVCFNSEETIETTLRSIYSQSYNSLEHIIIDGGSTDRTLEIIEKYRSDSTILVSEVDNGIYDAMNKGLAMASGHLIGILNSDDFYAHPEVLATVEQCFSANPQADGVFGDLCYVDRLNSEKVIRNWRAGNYKIEKFYWGWMPPHPSLFLRREVYNDVGLFNLKFSSAADYELIIRACLVYNKKLLYQPGVFVLMRAGGISNASLKNRLKANKEDALAWSINGLKPPKILRLLKPARKIGQLFNH